MPTTASDEAASSDNESFKSLDDEEQPVKTEETTPDTTTSTSKPVIQRYPPDEESRLVTESNGEKATANGLFGKGSYENAIQTYDRALSMCPNYLDYEIAVLRSNISACHLKLQEWKAAIDSASKGVECLDRLEPLPLLPKKENRDETQAAGEKSHDVVEEVDEEVADRIENLRSSGHSIHEVRTLQTKLLLRRARARSELTGWAELQAADEDYRILLTPAMQTSLTNTDKRTVVQAQRNLVPRLNAARENEVAEMMGKLKGLGNSILKPFGLSTENFQFNKDDRTGGYSMNFNQSPGK